MAQTHILTYNIHGLPWCRNNNEDILGWLAHQEFPLICLQEVFTTQGRIQYGKTLSAVGYDVLIPHDEGVSMFSSGLLTAVQHTSYRIIGTFFRPYLIYNYSDRFANKGFFGVHLEDRRTAKRFYIINTHTQSDWEASIIFGKADTTAIRFKQAEQILEHCKELRDPVLVVGDLNQENSLHPYLRSLHPITDLPLKKATFFQTGEDLDHIGWLPLQYAKKGCGFCDIRRRGPQLVECQIHAHTWSDHAAFSARVLIPDIPAE